MAEKKNVVRELIENGRRTGKLTTHEINDALEESSFDVDQLEKLYGEKYGKLIAFRKVDTGMTREMVIAAWGEPYHKSEVKKEGRTLETLRFSNDRCVELLDGKVQYVHVY